MTATSQKTGPKGPRDRPDPGSKMDRLLTLIEVSPSTGDLNTVRRSYERTYGEWPSGSQVSKVYRYLSPRLRERLFKLRYAREQARCSNKHRKDRKTRANLNRSSSS